MNTASKPNMPVQLFCRPSLEFRAAMDRLETALEEIAPLKAAHRRELPYAVRDLSELLTAGRAEMGRPYWAEPRLFAAYLRYFLPWNLIRLGRLLPGLALNKEGLKKAPLLVDIGSGPLTMPLALWLARPDLRDVPLAVLATDNASQPLAAGKKLFQAVVGADCVWQVHTIRAPLPGALREARAPIGLLSGANILNELEARRNEPLERRFAEVTELAARLLADDGQALFVEPGTRLGGRCISLLRASALECGFCAVSPCPHQESCPMLAPRVTSWCHFSFVFGREPGIPVWLERLTKAADLQKRSASLSFLHFARENKNLHLLESSLCGRILSEPIILPGHESGRYACTSRGLALVRNAAKLPMGAVTPLEWSADNERDAKSGAWIAYVPVLEQISGKVVYSIEKKKEDARRARSEPKERRPSTDTRWREKEKGEGKKFEPKTDVSNRRLNKNNK